MSLVVSPPDINHLIEFALQKLVVMIGNVRGKISGRTIAAYQDIVLILAQGARLKPGSICSFNNVAPALEQSHNPVILPPLVKASFCEPIVKNNVQQLEVVLNCLPHLGDPHL